MARRRWTACLEKATPTHYLRVIRQAGFRPRLRRSENLFARSFGSAAARRRYHRTYVNRTGASCELSPFQVEHKIVEQKLHLRAPLLFLDGEPREIQHKIKVSAKSFVAVRFMIEQRYERRDQRSRERRRGHPMNPTGTAHRVERQNTACIVRHHNVFLPGLRLLVRFPVAAAWFTIATESGLGIAPLLSARPNS